MMTDAGTIAAGAEAWSRIHHATDYASWKKVACALAIGRQHSLRLANVNAPHGAAYSRAFNGWLETNGFSSMPYGLRAKCCMLADHINEIEAWRDGLPEAQRAAQNQPEVIVRSWRRATAKPLQHQRQAPQHIVKDKKPTRPSKAVHWDQASVARAAAAMKESMSNDWLTLARISLQAAVRTRDDLIFLLDPAPTRAPAKSTPVQAVAFA